MSVHDKVDAQPPYKMLALDGGAMLARAWKEARAVDEREVQAIRSTLLETPGVAGVHDVRTRKMGDMIMVDAHLEVDGLMSVKQGHDIAVIARERVIQKLPVLDVMVHLDPV